MISMMKNEEYLTVKDFASAAGVSHQYIYRVLKTRLKPYSKRINGKIMIQSAAIDLFISSSAGCATNSTDWLQGCKPTNEAAAITVQQEIFATNSTEKHATSATGCKSIQTDNIAENATKGEVEILRELIEELRKSNEELKKDKETLIKDKEILLTESFKWQQLFLEERNKNKMLEEHNDLNEESAIETEIIEESIKKEKPKKKWFEFWKR